jgi:hypothetical protein
MQRPKQAIQQGEINGFFEIHFGVMLKKEKGANITAKLCREWQDRSAESVINGVRRYGEFRKKFEEHFHIESWNDPNHLLDPDALWEKCVEWEEKFKDFPSLNGNNHE